MDGQTDCRPMEKNQRVLKVIKFRVTLAPFTLGALHTPTRLLTWGPHVNGQWLDVLVAPRRWSQRLAGTLILLSGDTMILRVLSLSRWCYQYCEPQTQLVQLHQLQGISVNRPIGESTQVLVSQSLCKWLPYSQWIRTSDFKFQLSSDRVSVTTKPHKLCLKPSMKLQYINLLSINVCF